MMLFLSVFFTPYFSAIMSFSLCDVTFPPEERRTLLPSRPFSRHFPDSFDPLSHFDVALEYDRAGFTRPARLPDSET